MFLALSVTQAQLYKAWLILKAVSPSIKRDHSTLMHTDIHSHTLSQCPRWVILHTKVSELQINITLKQNSGSLSVCLSLRAPLVKQVLRHVSFGKCSSMMRGRVNIFQANSAIWLAAGTSWWRETGWHTFCIKFSCNFSIYLYTFFASLCLILQDSMNALNAKGITSSHRCALKC